LGEEVWRRICEKVLREILGGESLKEMWTGGERGEESGNGEAALALKPP
jgi:hypothetical protein